MRLEYVAPTQSLKIYSLKTQTTFWGEMANKGINFKVPFNIEKFNHFIKSIGLDKSAKILEIGCGYGRNLNLLQKEGYSNLMGVDFSTPMISRGKKEFPKLMLQCGDGRDLNNFNSASFDVIILFNVVTCMIKDEDQLALIKEVKRILKPAGLFYMSDLLLSEDPHLKKIYDISLPNYNQYGVYEFKGGGVCHDLHPDWVSKLLTEFKVEWETSDSIPSLCGKSAKPFQIIASYHPKLAPRPLVSSKL